LNNSSDPLFSKLIFDCIAEKRSAQKQLYQQFYSYGMGIAFRYAGDEDDAADILNDAFLKVFSNLSKFDQEKAFKPWFKTIVVNTSLDLIRKNLKYSANVPIEQAGDPIVHEVVLNNISYKEIVALVQRLSPAYRTVFNLYVIDGFQHNEIGEMLGISTGTSKSNLFKAKNKMKDLIKKYYKDEFARYA